MVKEDAPQHWPLLGALTEASQSWRWLQLLQEDDAAGRLGEAALSHCLQLGKERAHVRAVHALARAFDGVSAVGTLLPECDGCTPHAPPIPRVAATFLVARSSSRAKRYVCGSRPRH